MALDVDRSECCLLGSLEHLARFTGQVSNATVFLALDQVFSTMVADELNAVPRSSIWVFFFALEGQVFDKHIETDIRFVSAKILLVHDCETWAWFLYLRSANRSQGSKALACNDHIEQVRAKVGGCLEETEELDVVSTRESSAHLQSMSHALHSFFCCS